MHLKSRHLVGLIAILLVTAGAWFALRNERPGPTMPHVTSTAKRTGQKPRHEMLSRVNVLADCGLHWEERVKAVRELPLELAPATVEDLFAFLQSPPSAARNEWYMVCNEIMEVLRKRDLAPGIYTSNHLALIQSPTADPVIRDYAAQHLVQWISGIDPGASEQDPARAAAAFEALCVEAGNPANGHLTLAGTTLNGLADAVINGNSVMRRERAAVGRLAMEILDSPNVSVSNVNRATAIQVAARLNVTELPERCRSLARDPQVAVDLRLSSIAALGLVGGEDDRALLQSFVSDETFKFAAAAAVERVEQRSNKP
jgi:hypothetical protein